MLYRDVMALVIDKPAGLPVHAGPGGGPNLEAGLDALTFGARDRPVLAHRLDRDTAGCLALGRGPNGIKRLNRLFREGLVGKTYWAVCQGAPAEAEGEVDLPLAKRGDPGGWRMETAADGKPAVTRWRLLARRTSVAMSVHSARLATRQWTASARTAGATWFDVPSGHRTT